MTIADAMYRILTRRNDAIRAIEDEREFQDQKWGTIDEKPHTIGEWILLIEAELEEAKTALIKGGRGRDSVRSEIIQVAALALAALEQHGTNAVSYDREV